MPDLKDQTWIYIVPEYLENDTQDHSIRVQIQGQVNRTLLQEYKQNIHRNVVLLITKHIPMSAYICGGCYRNSLTGVWDLQFNTSLKQLIREELIGKDTIL